MLGAIHLSDAGHPRHSGPHRLRDRDANQTVDFAFDQDARSRMIGRVVVPDP
jgi:hypothetical protein